jgi:protein gp37
MIFVNSMSDLFHDSVPDEYIVDVAKIMIKANWHTYQVLTKRSKRLAKLLATKLKFASGESNIWWGVSVEDKKYGVPRISDMQGVAAGIRFLSIEPLLEDLGNLNLDGIHWVIVGGESGNGARPVRTEWVVSIRDQCRKFRIPFFFKQWGGVHKKKNGRLLDGRTYDEFPQSDSRRIFQLKKYVNISVKWNGDLRSFEAV